MKTKWYVLLIIVFFLLSPLNSIFLGLIAKMQNSIYPDFQYLTRVDAIHSPTKIVKTLLAFFLLGVYLWNKFRPIKHARFFYYPAFFVLLLLSLWYELSKMDLLGVLVAYLFSVF